MREPYYDDGQAVLYQGDVLLVLREMPAESVQCVVTSPPYWGLRDYGTATWEGGDAECDHKAARRAIGNSPSIKSTLTTNNGAGPKTGDKFSADSQFGYAPACPCGAVRVDEQIGLEETPEAYVVKMVEVFREVCRVLRKDGVIWVNLGDSYNSSGGHTIPESDGRANRTERSKMKGANVAGLKPKDLVGIPWMVAFALRADGWYLRSDIIWSKPNPMPESVTDRPTKSHEYIFLLSKSAAYFYDADAIREPHVRPWDATNGGSWAHTERFPRESAQGNHAGAYPLPNPAGRNKRSVWTVPTQSFEGAYFATFPEDLIKPCILAGTSERGCCATCGAPWERVVERTGHVNQREPAHVPGNAPTKTDSTGWAPTMRATDTWRTACKHVVSCYPSVIAEINWYAKPIAPQFFPSEPVPCVVLDPFAGSGTTMWVSKSLGRRSIGIDLNPAYLDLAVERVRQLALM